MKSLNDWLKEKDKKIKNLNEDDWFDISYQCELSEEFIRKYKKKVYWYYISRCQKLSEGFIREFKDRINFDYLIPCFYSEEFQSKIKCSWRYKRL